jgi:uncharacterized ubiquitin-like protein YukD
VTTLDSVEQVLRMLSYIATPVVAVAALKIASQQARIAGQQARVQERKYEADLYERRLRIYEEVKRLLSIVTRDANISMQDLLKFRVATSEADFLFGSDVPTYIDELYKHATNLAMWASIYRDYTQEPPPGYDHKATVDGKNREFAWITAQYEPSKELFKKYLHVSQ